MAYDNAGMYRSIVGHNQALPVFHSRQYPHTGSDNKAGVYVVMFRKATDPSAANAWTKVITTGQLVAWEYVIRPLALSQGWKIWMHSENPVDDRFKDSRWAPRVADTSTTDKPHEDTWRFFSHELETFNASESRVYWEPGQLIGPDGSRPGVKATSISFAPSFVLPGQPLADNRVATSGGCAIKHIRPYGVGLGWGDYDIFTSWEAHGRNLRKEWVVNKNWSTNRQTEDLVFVSKSGQTERITEQVHVMNMAYPFEIPRTLHEHLHGGGKRKYDI